MRKKEMMANEEKIINILNMVDHCNKMGRYLLDQAIIEIERSTQLSFEDICKIREAFPSSPIWKKQDFPPQVPF